MMFWIVAAAVVLVVAALVWWSSGRAKADLRKRSVETDIAITQGKASPYISNKLGGWRGGPSR